MIPLCSAPGSSTADATSNSHTNDTVIGLLRWADPVGHKGMLLPIVSMSRHGTGVHLIARSVDEYIHRCAFGISA